jgi:hypothetical protein
MEVAKIEAGNNTWENVVDGFLASPEYNDSFGDDAVPGGGRAGCGQAPSTVSLGKADAINLGGADGIVEQFYCRVLQRPPESDEVIAGWLVYLEDHTVKDLVKNGILGDEFKIRFVDGKSDETLAHTLYDVLLAREADAGGLADWTIEVAKIEAGNDTWENVVDGFLASTEYINNFGDDAVPGGGREECGHVPLEGADGYAIPAKTGNSTVPTTSSITKNIGVSPML